MKTVHYNSTSPHTSANITVIELIMYIKKLYLFNPLQLCIFSRATFTVNINRITVYQQQDRRAVSLIGS